MARMSDTAPRFAVVIPTMNRAEQLERTLQALEGQTRAGFDIVVVDDSPEVDQNLERRAAEGSLSVIRGPRRGLSHARNLGWRATSTETVVFLDDDCLPDGDWAEEFERALTDHPEASFVSGFVGEHEPPEGDYVPVTISPVIREGVKRGRWTKPWEIGFTLCMAIRRQTLESLEGFDERLGPGVKEFPSSEDMDFNYRFLKAGGVAYVTPRIRAMHDQWRSTTELPKHFRGYAAGVAGFAMKHLRSGDVLGGLWLWQFGVFDFARMLASAARRRSALRLRIAWWKLRGLVSGTAKGFARAW